MQLDQDPIRVLRLTVGLWLAYAVASVVIAAGLMPQTRLPLPLNVASMGIPTILFLLLSIAPLRRRLSVGIIPIVIVIMVILVSVLNYIALPPSLTNPNPITSAEGRTLRLLPISFMALVLTAWRYSWKYVLLFCAGSTGLSLLVFLSQPFLLRPELIAGLLALFVQAISFLLVGSFISVLMGDLRRQHADLEAANVQIRHHASTLESLTISRERNRMARELHDTVAHTLSGMAVQLETVKAYLQADPDTAARLLAQSLDAAKQGLQDTRRALRSLRASPLEDLGLNLALQKLAESAAQRGNLQLDLQLPATSIPIEITPDVEQCLYRVAQEAITNCVDHSGATQLKVHLSHQKRALSLLVQDNGRGFDPQQSKTLPGHFGLQGMRERAQLSGGKLHVESAPERGTQVVLTFCIDAIER